VGRCDISVAGFFSLNLFFDAMALVFLSLGSNMGDRGRFIASMTRRLKTVLLPPVTLSRLMKTEPVGVAGKQRWFYNRIVCGRYRGTAQELLARCRDIETSLGRISKKRFAPRTADIDILFFGNSKVARKNLVVPHPRIRERRFCLEGLAELVPDFKMPGTGQTMARLCSRMKESVRRQKVVFMDMPVRSPHGGLR
jgi:2-amino-4-hydroxy-6-hydroxymethyldihydropteridine diphosphokinase